MMARIGLFLALWCAAVLPVSAQDFGNTTGYAITTCGSPPVAYVPSSSTIARPGPFTIDANGNLCFFGTISGGISGFDSGAVTALGTVNSSSHAAGTSIGGLIAVPIARVAGGSGIITNFSWTSPGGATVQYVVRIWQKNPAGTTCTDQTAFVGNATDDRQLIVSPFAITPAAPANTTGDSKTYASVAGVTWDYKNADTSPGQNLYVCVMTTATDTADESSSPVVMLSGPQN